MLKAQRFITLTLICCVFCTLHAFGGQEAKKTPERRIHIKPPGPNESRYVYVPFEVPAHAVQISISYQYDRANGTNTIDIGLFDARSTGSDTDSRGFRGWSGGRRAELFVTKDEATPGYMPGVLPVGTWRIILGLYRVAPAGVDVTFKINIETDDEMGSLTRADRKARPSVTSAATAPVLASRVPSSPLPVRQVAVHGERWWLGDLHMHTIHSDGDWTVPELMSSARDTGLDFVFITDHNTASHHAEIDSLNKSAKRPLVMRGEEITTYGGHTNAWGLPSGKWIDFRVHPGDNTRMANIAAQAHGAGALISINHPFVLCGGCAWSYDAAARDFDAIEVWNGPWDFTDEPALKMWDKILQSGRHLTAIASSDSHRPDTPIGKPATHIAARVLSQSAILKAIQSGHVYLTDGASRLVNFEAEVSGSKHGSRLLSGDEIRLNAPGKLRFFISTGGNQSDATGTLISNGEVIRSFPTRAYSEPQLIEIDCRQNSYFRLEIRDKTKNVLALTNPIYVTVGKGR
ncbi:MAG: CehA/McbA family metallohydrolase [Acidobacteriota bacterium]